MVDNKGDYPRIQVEPATSWISGEGCATLIRVSLGDCDWDGNPIMWRRAGGWQIPRIGIYQRPGLARLYGNIYKRRRSNHFPCQDIPQTALCAYTQAISHTPIH